MPSVKERIVAFQQKASPGSKGSFSFKSCTATGDIVRAGWVQRSAGTHAFGLLPSYLRQYAVLFSDPALWFFEDEERTRPAGMAPLLPGRTTFTLTNMKMRNRVLEAELETIGNPWPGSGQPSGKAVRLRFAGASEAQLWLEAVNSVLNTAAPVQSPPPPAAAAASPIATPLAPAPLSSSGKAATTSMKLGQLVGGVELGGNSAANGAAHSGGAHLNGRLPNAVDAASVKLVVPTQQQQQQQQQQPPTSTDGASSPSARAPGVKVCLERDAKGSVHTTLRFAPNGATATPTAADVMLSKQVAAAIMDTAVRAAVDSMPPAALRSPPAASHTSGGAAIAAPTPLELRALLALSHRIHAASLAPGERSESPVLAGGASADAQLASSAERAVASLEESAIRLQVLALEALVRRLDAARPVAGAHAIQMTGREAAARPPPPGMTLTARLEAAVQWLESLAGTTP